MPKISSIRPPVLVELRLVTDRQTDTGPWLVPRMLSIARQKLPLTGGSRDVLYAPFYAQKDDSYTGRGRVAALQPIVAVKQKLNID